MKIKNLQAVPNEVYEYYDYPIEGKCSDVAMIDSKQAEAYYQAADIVYKLIVEATEDVINNKEYTRFGIPDFMIPAIEYSWENDHKHMIGRFDFAGGVDNLPIKLIEFNADTPFSIFETAVVQHYLAIANGYKDNQQFNYIFDTLKDSFAELSDISESPMMFTSWGSPEDELTTRIIGEAAEAAGGISLWRDWEQLYAHKDIGIFTSVDGRNIQYEFPYMFKMYPWEILAAEDPEMTKNICDAICAGNLTVFNPPYATIYQSKALLAKLWEMNSYHPFLLKTATEKHDIECVRKPIWGREGNNIAFISNEGEVVSETEGAYNEFSNDMYVYQDVAQFPSDDKGRRYQAGVFITDGVPSGLGFRRTNGSDKYEVITTNHELCGHVIED